MNNKETFDTIKQMIADGALGQETAEKYFPELAESEDEKIRKAIVAFFELQEDNTTFSFIPKKEILAWLEKQGEWKSNIIWNDTRIKQAPADKDILGWYRKSDGKLEGFPKIVWFCSDEESEKETNLAYWVELPEEGFDKTYWYGMQGEQKPVDNKISVDKDLFENIRNTCACIDDAMSSESLNDLKDYLSQAEASAQAAFDMIEKQKPVDLRTWKYIVDAVLTERGGIGQYIDSPWVTEVAEKLQKRFGAIEQKPVTHKYNVGATIYYNSFGEIKSMVVANVIDTGDGNPMYEDADGGGVFEKDLIKQKPTKSYSTLEITNTVRQALQECEGFRNIRADLYAARVGATVESLVRNQENKHQEIPHVKDRDSLDEYAYQCAYDLSNDWGKETPDWHDVQEACKLGAKWQEEHNQKPIESVEWSEKYIAEVFEKVGLSKVSRDLANDELTKALESAMIELAKTFKPIEWSEEDERMYRGLHNLIYSTPYCDSRKEFSDFLDSFKNRLQLNLQHEWSEEDDNMIMSINHHLDSQKNYVTNTTNIEQCQNWLKSLKDRVLPQLKQEWSEEDRAYLNIIIEDLKELYKKRKADPDSVLGKSQRDNIDWFKSLRPQKLSNVERNGKKWKPSEEQIKEVEEFRKYMKGE